MEIREKDILDKTHYGLNIYSHVLRQYYSDEVVIHLSGKQCKPAKNPFKDNTETLNIYNNNWVFVYEDFSDPDFNGNPFSFASLHYKLTGQELLQKLNEELHLRIGQQNNFYGNKRSAFIPNKEMQQEPITVPVFSFYKSPVRNIQPAYNINVIEAYNLIKSSDYKRTTEELRAINDKTEARNYKANHFDYVTFSGIFTKRNDKALQAHSGLITIDFDHIKDLVKLRKALLLDEYFDTVLIFVSPSGDGLKWIIPIDLAKANHQEYFKAVSNYIQQTYNLEVDKSGKDISRACFLPYDKDVFINPKYLQQ
ncbi:MAG: VirE protein [Bacteroidetes bacterium HGW-Bacteroidetes-4]|jgi:hypothetical protein|nr:MAG: VirE protein [Bacteroidetes bacterium HGW-Bacteroidetes-4]